MDGESTANPRFSLLDRLLRDASNPAKVECHRTAAPITGPFGLLPTELLEVVASHVLRVDAAAHGATLHEAARAAAASFAHLLRLCKGFGALPGMLRVEAAAHGRCSAPNLSVPCAHPFFAQVLEEIESIFVARALILAHQVALLHSNHTRTGLAYRQQNTRWAELGCDFVAGVRRMAVGERHMRMDPAWACCGTLLCATDGGAVVATKDRVVALEGTPARALNADTALHVAWSGTTAAQVTKATSRGALLALAVQHDLPDGIAHSIATWDMVRNVKVDARHEEGWLEELWFSPEGALHRLVTSMRESWLCFGNVMLRRSVGATPNCYTNLVCPYDAATTVSYCADTCDIAVLCSDRCSNPPHAQWSQELRCLSTPPCHEGRYAVGLNQRVDDFETNAPTFDSVAIAPRGDVMVVAGGGHVVPRFKFYERNEKRWGLRAETTFVEAYDCNLSWAGSGQLNAAFSPCGSLYVAMVSTVHTGVLVVNLRTTISTGDVSARFWRAASSTIPRTVCWRNGLWAETPEHGGVVRLGFSAALQA